MSSIKRIYTFGIRRISSFPSLAVRIFVGKRNPYGISQTITKADTPDARIIGIRNTAPVRRSRKRTAVIKNTQFISIVIGIFRFQILLHRIRNGITVCIGAQRIGSADSQSIEFRAIVTEGIVNTGIALQTVELAADTDLVERIEFTDEFGFNLVDTPQTNLTERPGQPQPGCAIPVFLSGGFRSLVAGRVAIAQSTVTQIEASLDIKDCLVSISQIFRTTKTDTVIVIIPHPEISSRFLDITDVENTIYGYITLCLGDTGKQTKNRQCDKCFFHFHLSFYKTIPSHGIKP